MRLFARAVIAAGCLLGTVGLVVPPTANATSVVLPNPVSETPAAFTPQVEDDAAVPHTAIYALEQSGGIMFAGGTFHTVANAREGSPVIRHNLFSFSATTGAMTNLAPTINGAVWALAPDGLGNLYVAGTFTSVNGVARRGIAKINATTGALVPGFNAHLTAGNVTQVRLSRGRLIIGGTFPERLAALNPTTGANTGYIDLDITGRLADNSGPTKVYRFALNPAGTRLVAVGNFTSVAGQTRFRAFMVDLNATEAVLDGWYYQPLEHPCRGFNLPAQLRDVDFSADGTFFVIVATGYVPVAGGVGHDICDAAARFNTIVKSPAHPVWINYTGGDTLHSVAIAGQVVYVQGHQRWLDNPTGRNSCGPAGCVSRPGIGGIDATTGKATAWNPTKSRGIGGKDLLVTPAGLWVASDGTKFNFKTRKNLAFCPEL
jgi:hypothetical protein